MFVFFYNYFSTLFILISFGIMGYFAIVPFRITLTYNYFATPLAGLLIATLGTSLIYNLLKLSLIKSAIISTIFCIICSSITFISIPSKFHLPNKKIIIFVLLTIGLLTYFINYSSIYFGNPGFLYMDGTDQLGYAQLADWINNHLVSDYPVLNPDLPYESYPQAMFNNDPRFGSFFLIGMISKFLHLSGMFVFDICCGVVLCAVYCAISTLFARSPLTFCLLFIGLITTYWLNYSRAGFFGKLVGLPSSFFTISLFILAVRPLTIPVIAILSCLVCASTIMYSCFMTVATFLTVGGTFCILDYFFYNKNFLILRDNIIILVVLIAISIATTGVLAKPINLSLYPLQTDLNWTWLLPRVVDLENTGEGITSLHSKFLFIIFNIFLIAPLIFFIVAFKRKNIISASLIIGPAILLIVLISFNLKSEIYQLIGTFYPWYLCGAIFLLNSHSNFTKKLTYSLTSLLLISILTHTPHSIATFNRYAGSKIDKSLQFSKNEMDNLATYIKNKKVFIDVKDTNYALPLLVEFKDNKNLQWSPDSWKSIVGYRQDWHAPKTDAPNSLRLVNNSHTIFPKCKIKLQMTQYNLLEC